MSRCRRAILVAAPMVSACQGLYQASLPQYNRCPSDLTEAWTSAKDVTRHTCFDKDHRPQGEVRGWRPDAGGYALVLKGSYRDGMPTGEWEEWTGPEKRTSTWNDRGQRVKVREFDAHGRMKAESTGDPSTGPLIDATIDAAGPPSAVAQAGQAPVAPSPWQADITVGGRGSGTAPVGGYASVVDAKLFFGWASWPKAHGVPFYVALGPMLTLGQSLLDACGRSGQPSCPDDFTWSLGPEGRVGIASMYTSEETGRPSPSVILFLGVAPTLRGARTVDTYAQKTVFALRMTAGLAVPRSWGTWSNLSKSDLPYFLPNEIEIVFETTAPSYLAYPSAWGAAGGYSF